MSRPRVRIRLAGIEVAAAEHSPVVVPWLCVQRKKPWLTVDEDFRSAHPVVPRRISLSDRQLGRVRALQARAIGKSIRAGSYQASWQGRFWRDAFPEICLLLVTTGSFVAWAVQGYAKWSVTSQPVREAFLAVLVLLGAAFGAMCALPWLMFGNELLFWLLPPRPSRVRATADGVQLEMRNGRCEFHPWDELVKIDTRFGGLWFRGRRRWIALPLSDHSTWYPLLQWLGRRDGVCRRADDGLTPSGLVVFVAAWLVGLAVISVVFGAGGWKVEERRGVLIYWNTACAAAILFCWLVNEKSRPRRWLARMWRQRRQGRGQVPA